MNVVCGIMKIVSKQKRTIKLKVNMKASETENKTFEEEKKTKILINETAEK